MTSLHEQQDEPPKPTIQTPYLKEVPLDVYRVIYTCSLLLIAEIRLTSWGNGSLSHYFQGLEYIPSG